MLSEALRELYVRVDEDGWLASVAVETDAGLYAIGTKGFAPLARVEPQSRPILPSAFRGRRIAEVRCDEADIIAIRLADGAFVTFSVLIDTQTGESYRDVLFYEPGEVHELLLEDWEELAPCGRTD